MSIHDAEYLTKRKEVYLKKNQTFLIVFLRENDVPCIFWGSTVWRVSSSGETNRSALHGRHASYMHVCLYIWMTIQSHWV